MTQTAEIRLQRAGGYLKEAEILYSEKIGNLPVLANLYHAMMNCLYALFDLEEPENILHDNIIERFKIEFVQAGILDKKFTVALDFAFHITHECNCEHMKPPGDEDINKLLPLVKEFVSVVTEYLNEM
jgi:uncharacterized protein (UPF0332 family)